MSDEKYATVMRVTTIVSAMLLVIAVVSTVTN